MANLSQYYPAPIVAGTTLGTYADGASAAHVGLANTFTANQTFSGTNSTAPNQTAASGASIMNRALTDTRVMEYLLTERGFYNMLPTWGQFTNVGSGSGALSTAGGGVRLATGATASSSSLYRANPGASFRFGRTNNIAGIDWTRRITLGWHGQIDCRANGTFRLQFGRGHNVTTIADLSSQGIGLILDGSTGALTAEVHNGTTRATSSTLATLTNNTAFWVSIRLQTSGGVLTVWVNDSQVGTLSGAPTTGSGSTANNIHLSIENGAASASYLVDNLGFQIFVAP